MRSAGVCVLQLRCVGTGQVIKKDGGHSESALTIVSTMPQMYLKTQTFLLALTLGCLSLPSGTQASQEDMRTRI